MKYIVHIVFYTLTGEGDICYNSSKCNYITVQTESQNPYTALCQVLAENNIGNDQIKTVTISELN